MSKYKVIMKDTLNWMKDVKFITFKESEVVEFIKKYGAMLTIADLIESDHIDIYTKDGLKLTVLKD